MAEMSCPDCEWSGEEMYCPECGARCEVVSEPSEPAVTKSDKV
jgi:hypothetical protein